MRYSSEISTGYGGHVGASACQRELNRFTDGDVQCQCAYMSSPYINSSLHLHICIFVLLYKG